MQANSVMGTATLLTCSWATTWHMCVFVHHPHLHLQNMITTNVKANHACIDAWVHHAMSLQQTHARYQKLHGQPCRDAGALQGMQKTRLLP